MALLRDQEVGAAAADEMPHLEAVGETGELWENHGWCVRAKDGKTEFLLWLAFYILRGHEKGRFTVGDVRVNQAICLHGKFPGSRRRQMNDSDFVVTGVNRDEFLAPNDLEASLGDDGWASWSLGGRAHRSRPPTWTVSGRAGALDLDLRFEALAPVSWFDGFELISGYEAIAAVSGRITVDGVAYEVSGFGQHEKVHTAVPIQRTDGAGWATLPIAERHMWHCGGDERLAFSMLANQPGERPDLINGQVVIEGAPVHFTRDQVRFEETGIWLDPRSGVSIPSGWRIEVEEARGKLTLDVSAYARAYYLWDYIRGSTSLLYWLMADAEATWESGNGRRLRLTLPYVAHTNRPFLYWGRESGPRRAREEMNKEDEGSVR